MSTSQEHNKPFRAEHFIGFVSQVMPEFVVAHIPSSHLLSLYHHRGEHYHPGVVGSYIVIEGEEYGFIGRIFELNLAEKERLQLTERSFEQEHLHPTAKIELLLSFNYFNPEVPNKGLDSHPHIGARIFSCSPKFLKRYLAAFGVDFSEKGHPLFDVATLSNDAQVSVDVSSQSLFGRHCAVVGTTGGGKSWTVARLLEECLRTGAKVILIDATGEYQPFVGLRGVSSCAIGDDVFFHYSNLTIPDLFYLLRPSDKVQRPKLVDAIRSLKAVRFNSGGNLQDPFDPSSTMKVEEGILKKVGSIRKVFERFYNQNASILDADDLQIDIQKLSRQIVEECIHLEDWDNKLAYGKRNEVELSHCTSLITRLTNIINTEGFKAIFGFENEVPDAEKSLINKLDNFLADGSLRVLRISLEDVGFDYQAREILANAIGKRLLLKARKKEFQNGSSLMVFIDEAHQFLNKTLQDEYASIQPLDAYDLIAKEGRKYGLFLCIATQMPRDIPIGTLSQMGTFIVHRLINKYDKESIENACSAAYKSSLSFLPILGRGEAILLGVDFPMPLSVKIKEPTVKPNSKTPPVVPRRESLVA